VRVRIGARITAIACLAVAGLSATVGLAQGIVTPALPATQLLLTFTYLLVGLLILERRPGNRVGPILFALGVFSAANVPATVYIESPEPLPGASVVAAAFNHLEVIPFVLVAALCMLFPDGHFISPRWRTVLLGMVVLAPIAYVVLALEPGPLSFYPQFENPFGVPGFPGQAIGEPIYLLVALGVAGSTSAFVVRWRHGGQLERAQLKWVGAAALATGIALVAGTITVGSSADTGLLGVVAGAVFALLPIAIGIAVLRYRLYEIDRLISRTIGWAIVTGLLVGTFALLVLGLQAVVEPLTGGNTLAIAGSTLVVAALFNPVRTRVQRAVDRRFDRSRYDGERLLAAFGERLRDEVDLATISADVLATVDAAVRPSAAGLWLRERERGGTG
jgi:hypothetical protein